MKIKNLSFIEQHIEKLALGFATLVVLAVAYFYVLGSPNTIELNGNEVGPGEVDLVIHREAMTLSQRLDQNELAAPIAALTVPEFEEQFIDAYQSVARLPERPALPLAVAPYMPGDEGDESSTPYHVPNVPTPTILAHRTALGTIDAEELDLFESFGIREKLNLPEGGPNDISYVSFLGEFDLKAMLNELELEPEDENVERALPPEWWENPFVIADVQLERQQQRPDGTWPQTDDADYAALTTIVDPMPNNPNLRRYMQDIEPDRAPELVAILQQMQGDIIQPIFPFLTGQPWLPPDPQFQDNLTDAKIDVILELSKRIASKEQQIAALERQIERAKEQQQRSSDAASARQSAASRSSGPRNLDAGTQSAIQQAIAEATSRGGGGGRMAPTAADINQMRSAANPNSRSSGRSAVNVDPRKARMDRMQERLDQAKKDLTELQNEYFQQTNTTAVSASVQRRAIAGGVTLRPAVSRGVPSTVSIPGGPGGPPPGILEQIQRESAMRSAAGGGGAPRMAPTADEINRMRESARPGAGQTSGPPPGLREQMARESAMRSAAGSGGAPRMAPTADEINRMRQNAIAGATGNRRPATAPTRPTAPIVAPAQRPQVPTSDAGRSTELERRLQMLAGDTGDEQPQEVEPVKVERDRLGVLYLDPPTVELWANDLTAEPGRTYRYRLRVAVLNPLFGKGRLLPESQRDELNNQLLLQSDWSDWTEPIRVDSKTHFFLVDAARTGASPSVTVEVWRFNDGTWQNAQFRVQNGDPIGAEKTISIPDPFGIDPPQQTQVDFSTGSVVVDVESDFATQSGTTTRLLYMNNGELEYKRLDEDSDSALRRRLQAEQELASPPTLGSR